MLLNGHFSTISIIFVPISYHFSPCFWLFYLYKPLFANFFVIKFSQKNKEIKWKICMMWWLAVAHWFVWPDRVTSRRERWMGGYCTRIPNPEQLGTYLSMIFRQTVSTRCSLKMFRYLRMNWKPKSSFIRSTDFHKQIAHRVLSFIRIINWVSLPAQQTIQSFTAAPCQILLLKREIR